MKDKPPVSADNSKPADKQSDVGEAPPKPKSPAELDAEKAAAAEPTRPIAPAPQPTHTGQGMRLMTHAMAAAEAEETVEMVVPRHFQLTLDDGSAIKFVPGTYPVPVSAKIKRVVNGEEKELVVPIAEHPYLAAHGCKKKGS